MELDSNGYPTGESIRKIERWEYTDGHDALLEAISPLVEGYGRCEKRTVDGVWEFATGGWSGNEEIIQALENNFMFWGMCWQLSRRGGYYEFKPRN
jgi:hypothetical protein